MKSNLERRTKIEELRSQLKSDLVALEAKFRQDTSALEKKCRTDISAIEREIKESEAQELRTARDQIQQIIAATGLDPAAVLASLAGARGAKKTPATRKPMKPSTVQHTGPNGQVWNGRGRVPQWFKDRHGSASGHQHH